MLFLVGSVWAFWWVNAECCSAACLGEEWLGMWKMNCLVTLLILLFWPITLHIPFPTTASEALSSSPPPSRRPCCRPARCFRRQDGKTASKNKKTWSTFSKAWEQPTFDVFFFFVDMVCNQFMILRYLFQSTGDIAFLEYSMANMWCWYDPKGTTSSGQELWVPRFPSPTPFHGCLGVKLGAHLTLQIDDFLPLLRGALKQSSPSNGF